MDISEVLIDLCSLSGPSGSESELTRRAAELLLPYMDEVSTDVMGNVIGVRKCGKKDAKRLLLDAHIDEIGLAVMAIEEGFLKIAPIGGLDLRILPASEVKVLSNPPIFGVICAMPPHVLKKEDSDKAVKIEDMFVDIGLKQEEAEKVVPLGTPIVYGHGARRVGANRICGKALDDRAGFVSILHALELLKGAELNIDLYVMASVQEEVGVRGAGPGAFAVNPDYSIVVDVGHAKTPDSKSSDHTQVLGGGVIISRGPNMNSTLTQLAVNAARENGMNHQIEVIPTGNSGTNTRAIQVSREGVATLLFGIPLKYMHGAYETAEISDIESVGRLISETAKRIKG